MKHHIKDSCRKVAVKFLAPIPHCIFLFFFLICFHPNVSFAQSLSQTTTPDIGQGKLIEFVEGEYILGDGLGVPETVWERAPIPIIQTASQNGWRVGDYHTLHGRFYFQQQVVGDGPIAIYTVGMRNNFTKYISTAPKYFEITQISAIRKMRGTVRF